MSCIKIGADPEVFIIDKSGSFVPACGLVPGTKDNPFKVDRGAVQVDGVAAEFNIDPAETAEQFNVNIKVVLAQLLRHIRSIDKDLDIRFAPIAKFSQDVWDKVPDSAKVLGCDPDYNIDGQINVNPSERILDQPIRTAAGHIHIGFVNEMTSYHFQDCVYIAKGFFNSGLSLFTPNTPEEHERLNYYGHSGSFRPKPYGIELRAPSNLWVASDKTRIEAFNQVRNTFKTLTGL